MDRTALRLTLRNLVESNTGEPVQQFADDTNLRTGLGLDSVDMITMAMELQDRLPVTIEVEDFAQLNTVGDLLDLLLARIPAGARAA